MSGAVRIACLRRHAPRWRALSTSTHEQSLPPPPPSHLQLLISRNKDREREPRDLHPRMIFVRPWDGIPTMAHAFAVVCEIERQFGRIQEFVVVRDSDVHSSCCPFLHATFSRAEDANAIPLDGKVIQVKTPDVDEHRDGGIGLDDLHVYLNPETRERVLLDRDSETEKEREWGPPEGKVMDVKLERTSSRGPPPVLGQTLGFRRRFPPHVNNPKRTQELAHAIHAFGGFVGPSSHSQGGQTPMEAIVSRWSRLVKLPPQPSPVPTQENILAETPTETPTEKFETRVSPEGEIGWTSFASQSAASLPRSESIYFTSTATPIPSSPLAAPAPIMSSGPSSEAINDKHKPKFKPEPKSEPKPEPHVTKTEPRMSKKLRLLNAARLAGKLAAVKPLNNPEKAVEAHPQTNHTPNSSTEHVNTELGHNPRGSEAENKVAARKWWSFFSGGN